MKTTFYINGKEWLCDYEVYYQAPSALDIPIITGNEARADISYGNTAIPDTCRLITFHFKLRTTTRHTHAIYDLYDIGGVT